jgi:adenylate cyclase
MIKLKKIFPRDSFFLLAVGVGASLLLVALYIFQPVFLEFLDYKVYDQLLRSTHTEETSDAITIVDLDEKSLAKFGQWPWPRYRLALLLANLQNAGALSVGLDMLIAEPDRTSPKEMQRQIKRDLGVDMGFTGLPEKLMENDKVLASVLSGGPFVLGSYFAFSQDQVQSEIYEQSACGGDPMSLAFITTGDTEPDTDFMLSPLGTVCPLDILAESAPSQGFLNTISDLDGIIRRVPLMVSYKDKVYASLALSTLMEALRTKSSVLKITPMGAESLRLAKQIIVPLDPQGLFVVKFRGSSGSFPYVSAGDILDGTFDPNLIKNRIVLIGTSATGLKDLKTTPFEPNFPGVEVHATVIDNILTQDFLTRPDWAPGLELVVLVVAGIVTTLLIIWTKPIFILLPLLLLAWAMWYGATWAMTEHQIYISPLYPFLILALNFALLTFLKFVREERQRKFISTAFSKYVSPAVVGQIIDSPDKLSLRGEEKDVSILFSDIRSFTSLSEQLTPTQVTDLLHSYLTPMTRVVMDNLGTLDKFIGDAVMAFWNAPVTIEEPQKRSLLAALQMLEKLDELNVEFLKRFGFPVRIGIGLHSGQVRVGNMGSADLFDYTIIGDNVNLASRLEGLTKFYGMSLVISEVHKEACGSDFLYQELDRVRVKGKQKPISLFTAYTLDIGENKKKELEAWEQALALYKSGNFAKSQPMFAKLAERFDRQIYKMYAHRSDQFIHHPPEGEWDGVFTHKSK